MANCASERLTSGAGSRLFLRSPLHALIPPPTACTHARAHAQYIYITLEEMHAVANQLRQRGRMSITELAATPLIDLEPKPLPCSGGGAGGGRPALAFADVLGADGAA